MLLKGECMVHTTTMLFSIHGEPNNWQLTVSAPGNTYLNRMTNDATPYALLDEMLMAAFDSCCRQFPERTPPPKPAPPSFQKRKPLKLRAGR